MSNSPEKWILGQNHLLETLADEDPKLKKKNFLSSQEEKLLEFSRSPKLALTEPQNHSRCSIYGRQVQRSGGQRSFRISDEQLANSLGPVRPYALAIEATDVGTEAVPEDTTDFFPTS